jgi:hypothetical protein
VQGKKGIVKNKLVSKKLQLTMDILAEHCSLCADDSEGKHKAQ